MKEKISYLALVCVGLLSLIVLLICFAKYIFPLLLPFLIAWLISSITVAPAKKLSSIIKAPERIIRLVTSVVFTLIFVSVATLLLWRITTALWHFLAHIAEKNRLYDLLSIILSKDLPLLGEFIPEELAARISEAFGSLISSGLSLLAEGVTSVVSGVPKLFFFLVVTLISLVYFSLDYDKITTFLKSVLPKKLSHVLSKIRQGVSVVLKKYVLSYSLIMLITYLTLLLGFLILRVEQGAILAFFIALLDILPIIGVGTVLVPWSIYEIALGNARLGVGLIILFVANAIIRQLSEPKILGKSLNVHPIITLMLIYIGYALFGIFGMLLLPIGAVVVGMVLKGNNTAEIT